MRLHEEKLAFRELMNRVNERSGYRIDVLEKDYYVTLFLDELARKQKDGLKAYFKGGTALYKALKSVKRFSEDIDLSVDARGCSRSQEKKRLNDATKRYASLERIEGDGVSNRSSVLVSYRYEPLYRGNMDDSLQRFGRVKVEATSFTISEPVEALSISPLVYDLASAEEREVLEADYDIVPFDVQTISFERIFIDKLFAAEAYARTSDIEGRAFEAAKHIYDLAVIADHPRVSRLLNDDERLRLLLSIRYAEEQARLDGIPEVPTMDFRFFDMISTRRNIRIAYSKMLDVYVFDERDRIALESVLEILKKLERDLKKCHSWNDHQLLEKERKRYERVENGIEDDGAK